MRFRHDERGAIAIIFGLSLFLIIFAIGFALDGAQAVRTSSKIANALDAASLAAARALAEGGNSTAEVETLARSAFEAQMASTDAGTFHWANFEVNIDPASGSVMIVADVEVPTSFSRILNIDTIKFTRSSTSMFKMRNIELAMVLDITGSMGGQKIADLKLAATDIVDILLPAGSPATNRIALVPYAASINAGAYAALASNNESLDNCVVERHGSHAYSDDAPDSGRYFEVEDDPPGNNNYMCPTAEIMPLTSDRNLVKAEISTLAADGWTAGHIGLGWGWYTISPSWTPVWPSSADPKPYADPNTIKAIILMTDGEFNTSYHNGPENETSAEQAIDICNAIKDPDVTGGTVVIYSVAFQSPPAAKATLQTCATSPTHYFSADNSTELRMAFQDIAKRLQNLRIAK
jgi:Flp pilus assembly protein TadG